MAEDKMVNDKSFKEVTQEIKETNKLLKMQMTNDDKGAKLGASIKNAAGEIINDRLIGRTAKKESDETQVKIEKLKEQNKDDNIKNNKVWKGIANTLTGAFIGKKNGQTPGRTEEDKKDMFSSLKSMFGKYLGPKSFVGKNLLGVFGGIKKLFKGLYGKGKGILGVLLTVGAYGLLLKFLNSEGFNEFMKNDAPAKIAAGLEKIFKKGGLLDRLSVLFIGDGTKGEGGKKGLLGHLLSIAGGFLGLTDQSGWAAIGVAITALKDSIFGKKKSTTYGDSGDSGGLLGGLGTLASILLGIGAAITLPAIIAFAPGLLLKGTLLLVGVGLIINAIGKFNEFLGFSARALNKETGLRETGIENVLPLNTNTVKRILGGGRTLGNKEFVQSNKGNYFKRGLDGKATTIKAPDNFKPSKGFDKAPKWFKTLIKRIPLLGQAMMAYDLSTILSGNMPWQANPDQPSKAKSLMSLAGQGIGMTAGSIFGTIGGPLGVLAGMFLGTKGGGAAGEGLYKYAWLLSQGVSQSDIILGMGKNAITSGGLLFQDNTTDAKITPNVSTYGNVIGKGLDFVASRGGNPNLIQEKTVDNENLYIPAKNDAEFLAKHNYTITNVNDNKSSTTVDGGIIQIGNQDSSLGNTNTSGVWGF